jgi:RHS repeat-associated protein
MSGGVFLSWDPLGIAPQWDWRGDPYSYTLYGPTAPCKTQGTWPSNCVQIDFPNQLLYYRTSTDYSRELEGGWYGSLLDNQRDASGQQFRRNRYYDPETGRFTQEDPARLAGGLNLYGFANGDPASYGDPFGLFPIPLIVAGLWALYEAGSAAYDVYQAYKTLRDPNASITLKTAMVSAATASVFGPGGGTTALVKGGSALVRASKALDNAYLTGERLGHIIQRHAYGTTAKHAGKFAKGADIVGLIKKAVNSDATVIKPGRDGKIMFEATFDTPIGTNISGAVATKLRVIVESDGRIITAYPF